MRWNQQKIHDSLCHKGLQWHQSSFVSFERGALEALVKSAKKILQFLLRDRILDEESLHTLMEEVESTFNYRPLTPVSHSPDGIAALTPMALLSGCIAPPLPPCVFIKDDGHRRSWRAGKLLSDYFWQRWLKEYLPFLEQRQKWITPTRNLRTGDLGLVSDEHSNRGCWPKALVEVTYPDSDGILRRVLVHTTHGRFIRDAGKLCLPKANDKA